MSADRTLPTGTVTFLFTDIEGSTLMVQELGERWIDVLEAQRRVMRRAITDNDGHEMGTEGDSFFVVFASAVKAVKAVVTAQQALAAEPWPEGFPVRVRMGLHTGEARLVGGDYIGLEVHRAARIASAGHGGQVVLSEPTQALIETDLPSDVTLRDLGEHRLKDLPRPERIFQLDIPGLPAEFPALKSLNLRRNNLPLRLTTFVGRGAELAELKSLLAHERLLTLAGPGGMGKTSLAIQLGADVMAAYSQGVWLTELAALSDPNLVAPTVLTVFGLREQPGRSPTATLIDYLHTREVLLILDNCEHLLEPSAQLAEALLQDCPHLRIVATSRQGLGVAGEMVWRVPSLTVPDPKRLLPLDVTAESAAVVLFTDRAAAANPSFTLTEKSAPLVVQICGALDGIPLAIELAAARLKMLSIEQLAVRLKDRFRVLTGGSRTALPRQQTLRAAIDWSFELLAEPERALLRRLSIFAGGFRLEAAEAICAWDPLTADDVLDLLDALAAKSLLVVEEARDVPRYHLLETIRQYAAERVTAAAEDKPLQTRHREWFLDVARRGEQELHGPDQLPWFERLELELENLRAGFECCLAGGAPGQALEFAAALGLFWRARGRFNEGRDWLDRALRAVGGARTALRARALAWHGLLTSYQGAYADGIVRQEESLAIYEELDDDWGKAFALQNLAAALHAQDDYERASRLHEQSLALFRKTGDKPWIGFALTHLGFGALARGDYAEAMAMLEEALALAREAQDTRQIGIALQLMGEVELAQEHYAPASSLLEESLTLVRQAKDKVDVASTLRLLGIVARCQGDLERATALQQESLELAREVNIKEFEAETLCELGIIAGLQGDPDQAGTLLRSALSTFGLSEQFGIARCLESLASIALKTAHWSLAATLYAGAEGLRDHIGSPLRQYEMADHDQQIDAVRAALGTQALEDAWREGAAMRVEHMVALALREDPVVSPSGAPSSAVLDQPLSARRP
jgi:predicted ATPase/class 3 adenylate cyclase